MRMVSLAAIQSGCTPNQQENIATADRLVRRAVGEGMIDLRQTESLRGGFLPRARPITELASSDHELTRIRETCTVCPHG
jgi:hypothetical protein